MPKYTYIFTVKHMLKDLEKVILVILQRQKQY